MSNLKIGTIYRAVNSINRKSYIGKTFNFRKRKAQHRHNAKYNKHKSNYFHNAIRKYGFELFTWETLFVGPCHPNKLNALESFFIHYYDTMTNGYNLTDGGECLYVLSPRNLKARNQKISRTMNAINTKTGLSKAQTIGRSNKEKLSKINPETGLTGYQEIGLKVSKSLNRVDTITGCTVAQRRALSAAATMNMIDQETGTSIYQRTGKKVSETLKKNKTHIGMKNPNAKRYLIALANGQLIGSHGGFKRVCEKYSLNYARAKSFIDKGVIPRCRTFNQQSVNLEGCQIISQ